MIVRTSFPKLADPSRRDVFAREIAAALEGAGHLWATVGPPADEASQVWDLAVLVGCPDEDVVREIHRRIVAALGESAVVFKAWSFSAAP